jgi:hypothetical protein
MAELAFNLPSLERRRSGLEVEAEDTMVEVVLGLVAMEAEVLERRILLAVQ